MLCHETAVGEFGMNALEVDLDEEVEVAHLIHGACGSVGTHAELSIDDSAQEDMLSNWKAEDLVRGGQSVAEETDIM